MGMSASQVRFLSLQSRKNDVSRQLMSLSNRKMSLSRDMNKVSQHYTEALNQKLLKWSNDSGASYNQLTYDLMMRPNDLNTETPYIVTNATNGKVILNNDELTDSEGNGLGISYVDIAKMISSYQGVDTNGDVVYDTTKECYNITRNDQTITVGDKAIDGAYFIPDSTKDFSFDNCLRYEIFIKMGLISEAEHNKQIDYLIQLYGSEEAQKTGRYPVGSAWGDYYIAQAKLESYEQFLRDEHYLSSANTYDGTKKPTKTYADEDYSTYIDGTSSQGTTTITQTPIISTGALDHVDFNSAVLQNTTGTYDYISADEDPAKWSSTEIDNLFNTYDDAQTGMDTTWGASYVIDMSKSGITFTYTYDDLLANALANYTGSTSVKDCYNNDFDIAAALQADDANTGARSLTICELDRQYYGTDRKTKSARREKLTSIAEKFVDIMKSTTTTKLDENALNKAKQQTIELYMANTKVYDTDSCDTPGEARKEAINYGGVAINHQQWHIDWHGIWPDPDCAKTSAAVDVKTMFNTFMTYYNYYASNPTASAGLAVTGTNDIPEIYFETSNNDDTAKKGVVGGNTYLVNTETGTDDNGVTVVSVNRTMLTQDINQAVNGNKIAFLRSSGNLVDDREYNVMLDDGPYYEKKNESAESLMYYADKQSHGNTFNGQDVYGTIQKGNKLYYCTSRAELDAYLNYGTLPANSVDYTADQSNAYPVLILGGDPSQNDEDKIEIAEWKGNSYYDIKVDGSITEDTDYHQYLRDNVTDAMNKIKELESNLSNLYGAAEQKLMDYYDALFMRIAENGWEIDESTSADKTTSTEYLNNKLQNNDYFVTVCQQKADETGYNYTAKMATSVMKIYEVNDDSAQNQALAKYESDKTLISNKEAKIDAMMQKLETEQEAINTEMESVQKIVSENIDKTFKIFA